MNASDAPASRETILYFLSRAARAASEFGTEIEDEVLRASELPLDVETAERLYTRVLSIIETGRDSAEPGISVPENIRREVASLIERLPRPSMSADALAELDGAPTARPPVELCEHNGLKPHDVSPVPQFNGRVIPMREGYVDVTLIDPWAENARARLYVDEFYAKYNREPDADELLKILTGDIQLGDGDRDPFKLRPLASSIARKGVEKPPIITKDGIPYDGNRRIAASRFVLMSDGFDEEQKERARWVKVWQTGEVTPDQLEAVVVALNFEEDLKEPWPEYVKARMVVDKVNDLREQQAGLVNSSRALNKLKDEAAKTFAISRSDVTRYMGMVKWADDFRDYHVEGGKDRSAVEYRTDTIFQWFYEIQAGTAGSKITDQFDDDPELRKLVYDMMYDATFDSGAQVRAMYIVADDPEAHRQLIEAHQIREARPDEAKEIIKDAINDARRRARAKKGMALEEYARGFVKRLSETPASAWETFDESLLLDVRRTLISTFGNVSGELSRRGDDYVPVELS